MSRKRDRTNGPVYGSVTQYLQGTVNTVTETILGQRIESITDVVTQDFHRKIQAGEIINNPMHYVNSSINNDTGGTYRAVNVVQPELNTPTGAQYEMRGTGNLSRAVDLLVGAPFTVAYLAPKVFASSHADEARSRAMGNVDRTPYSFAEDIAEMRETVRFLKDPTAALRDLSQAFSNAWANRKRLERLKGTLNLSKAFAEVWLQYRFALSPLLRSLEDGLKAALDDTILPPRRVARGFYNDVHFDSDVIDAGVPNNLLRWKRTISQTREVKAGILYEVTNPVQDWRSKYGLRHKDIPELMWAILPYSFMYDRLINLSQTIRGIESYLDPNVKYLAGWVTTKDKVTLTKSWTDQINPVYAVTLSPDVESHEDFIYDRVVWEPSLGDTIGKFDPTGLVDDATKVTDLLSLILVNLKK